MARYFTLADVALPENLTLAARKARRRKSRRGDVEDFFLQQESHLLRLHEKLLSGTWSPSGYRLFEIREPKRRMIAAASFEDRVVHHALCNLMQPVLERRFIARSYSCQVGKGTTAARECCRQLVNRHRYVLKCDVRKFFDSIPHDILLKKLTQRLRCPGVLELCGRIVRSYSAQTAQGTVRTAFREPTACAGSYGLPIGNLTSQLWGNFILDEMDHWITEEKRHGAYLRYTDDFLIFGDDPARLWELRDGVQKKLLRLRLHLAEPKSRLLNTAEGVPFCGFRFHPGLRARVLGSTKRRFEKRRDQLRGVKGLAALTQSVGAWYAFSAEGNTVGLKRAYTRRTPNSRAAQTSERSAKMRTELSPGDFFATGDSNMNTVTTPILRLEAALPTHWALGESRLVKVHLSNQSAVDLQKVHVRTRWSGTVRTEALWQIVGNLRRGMGLEISLQTPAPPGQEDQFQIEVQMEVGSFLKLELWSAKVDVKCLGRPGADGGIVINAGIQGDKIGQNQILAEGGSGVGNVFHFGDRVPPAKEFQNWLDQGSGVRSELPLFIAQEICHPWVSQCGISLRGLASGRFRMGASADDLEADPEERPARDVVLTEGFWMSAYPITQSEYERVTGNRAPVEHEGHVGDQMPVACVTWSEAMSFCEELTCMEHAAGALPPSYAYRLPSEAQWEYACRAGTRTPHYGPLEKIGAVKLNTGGMGAVGRFVPNDWGLHDMLGLVFEWCRDAYGPYKMLEMEDPMRELPEPGQPLRRVVRGGCYQGPDVFARASARFGRDPMESSHRIGFRIVLARQ
jgi:hypothetical protein